MAGELIPEVWADIPQAQLAPNRISPSRPQYQTALDSRPRPAWEIARRPPNSGVRAIVTEAPIDYGPGQIPWPIYSEIIDTQPPTGWLAGECNCP